MTPTECREALELTSAAKTLKQQLDTFVLLQRSERHSEKIHVGPLGRDNLGSVQPVDIPLAARRHVFALWRRETALKFNEKVRRLRQLGVATDLELVAFSPATGEPM